MSTEPEPDPTSNLEIANRLREWRQKIAILERFAVANKLEISDSKLGNYEHGRTPLPWGAAHDLWRHFRLSPRWLATGKGGVHKPYPVLQVLRPAADPALSLAEAYPDSLAPLLESQAAMEAASARRTVENFLGEVAKDKVDETTLCAVAEAIHAMHPTMMRVFVIGAGGKKPGELTRGEHSRTRRPQRPAPN
jgi:hypothetical protein